MIKKFTDKYLNSFDILNEAVIGFEFEYYCNKPYYKQQEILNNLLSPIKVHGFKVYHSEYKPDENNFKIEPDLSGGEEMCELITGPMNYVKSKLILLKILKFINDNCYTTDKSSIHINISFNNKTNVDINKLKIILEVDEDFVYSFFPERRGNLYSKSVKRLVPFKNYSYADNAINQLISNLEIPETKYYGINLTDYKTGRIEFRYIGGKDYQQKSAEILELMDYFILLSWKCTIEKLTDDNKKELLEYLSKNINTFKNFSSPENFISEFPSIKIEVDKNSSLNVIKSYYGRFYEKLYDLVNGTRNLMDCVLNFDIDGGRLEVVGANIGCTFDLDDYVFIDCKIKSGILTNCRFIDSELSSVQLQDSKIFGSDLLSCKVDTCGVDSMSNLKDCYIFNSDIDCVVYGGVFRSGRLGQEGSLKDNVKVIKNGVNYNDS